MIYVGDDALAPEDPIINAVGDVHTSYRNALDSEHLVVLQNHDAKTKEALNAYTNIQEICSSYNRYLKSSLLVYNDTDLVYIARGDSVISLNIDENKRTCLEGIEDQPLASGWKIPFTVDCGLCAVINHVSINNIEVTLKEKYSIPLELKLYPEPSNPIINYFNADEKGFVELEFLDKIFSLVQNRPLNVEGGKLEDAFRELNNKSLPFRKTFIYSSIMDIFQVPLIKHVNVLKKEGENVQLYISGFFPNSINISNNKKTRTKSGELNITEFNF